MQIDVLGQSTYCYTGGRPFDAAQPTVVLLHGVLNDHSVWILQSRWLAHHGFSVLAPDLPGHCRSAGLPPASVEDAADFVLALLDAAGVADAALVGHSFGSLVALEAAGRAPGRVRQLALLGTAAPMRVSPALLDASRDAPERGIAMVNTFSHSTLAPPPSALGPGTWLYGSGRALMRRVLASNRQANVFHTGFVACDAYGGAAARLAAARCPVLVVAGDSDQMTPPKSAEALVDAGRAAGADVRLQRVPAGHQMMLEAPEETLAALREFLRMTG